jgi:hypothetical protein
VCLRTLIAAAPEKGKINENALHTSLGHRAETGKARCERLVHAEGHNAEVVLDWQIHKDEIGGHIGIIQVCVRHADDLAPPARHFHLFFPFQALLQ